MSNSMYSPNTSWQYPAAGQNFQQYPSEQMQSPSTDASFSMMNYNNSAPSINNNPQPNYFSSPLLNSMQMMSGDQQQQQQQQAWPQQQQWSMPLLAGNGGVPSINSLMAIGGDQRNQQMQMPLSMPTSMSSNSSSMPMQLTPWQQWQIQQQLQQLSRSATGPSAAYPQMPLMMSTQQQRPGGQTLFYPGSMNASAAMPMQFNNSNNTCSRCSMGMESAADTATADISKKNFLNPGTTILRRSDAGRQARNKSSINFQ